MSYARAETMLFLVPKDVIWIGPICWIQRYYAGGKFVCIIVYSWIYGRKNSGECNLELRAMLPNYVKNRLLFLFSCPCLGHPVSYLLEIGPQSRQLRLLPRVVTLHGLSCQTWLKVCTSRLSIVCTSRLLAYFPKYLSWKLDSCYYLLLVPWKQYLKGKVYYNNLMAC